MGDRDGPQLAVKVERDQLEDGPTLPERDVQQSPRPQLDGAEVSEAEFQSTSLASSYSVTRKQDSETTLDPKRLTRGPSLDTERQGRRTSRRRASRRSGRPSVLKRKDVLEGGSILDRLMLWIADTLKKLELKLVRKVESPPELELSPSQNKSTKKSKLEEEAEREATEEAARETAQDGPSPSRE